MKSRPAIASVTSAPSAPTADVTDALYGQHLAKVKRWARRLAGPSADLEDLVHDIFLIALRKGFQVRGERFNADCTGFIEAVYALEGVPLRTLMRAAAPDERSGVWAAFRTLERYGVVFGGGGEWPAPGDLVFWHDTWDRNGNGKADDRFTHVGIVEYVVDGTVVFLHRGSKGVARGAMTPERPGERSAGGVALNSPLRSRNPRLEGVPVLAGALFAAYARIDPARMPRGLDVASAPR